jgi:hypothetical protein
MADTKKETNNNNTGTTDKSKKVDNKGQTNNTGITDKIKNALGGSMANGLAIILIIGVIVAIIFLIVIHQHALDLNHTTYETILSTMSNKSSALYGENASDMLQSFQNYYRETNISNTNLISILLPVFGAWIGAILAFYYGNKNMEKISESANNVIDKLSERTKTEEDYLKMKIKEILDLVPSYKDYKSAKISENIGKKFADAGSVSTILLTTDDGKPLGFLSKSDLFTGDTKEDIFKEKTFKEYFTQNQVKDNITGNIWTEKGVQNYATVSLQDTLQQAIAKLRLISEKQSVRGLVLGDNNKIMGLITYGLLGDVMKKEEEKKT